MKIQVEVPKTKAPFKACKTRSERADADSAGTLAGSGASQCPDGWGPPPTTAECRVASENGALKSSGRFRLLKGNVGRETEDRLNNNCRLHYEAHIPRSCVGLGKCVETRSSKDCSDSSSSSISTATSPTATSINTSTIATSTARLL